MERDAPPVRRTITQQAAVSAAHAANVGLSGRQRLVGGEGKAGGGECKRRQHHLGHTERSTTRFNFGTRTHWQWCDAGTLVMPLARVADDWQ